MSSTSHGLPLVRRVLRERRGVVIPLALVLALNLLVDAFVVYPLSQQVANVEERTLAAEQNLSAARQDYAQASGTLTGKDRAATELATFYERVLPPDLAGARRLTHLRLAQLARESNLENKNSEFETVAERGSSLTRLKIEMELAGAWADVRTFIHQLETSPEFVVVDNIQLAEEADESGLQVRLQLSTYYRGSPR